MTISLRKGKEIPKKTNSNIYKLVVANQHGDNQATTYTKYYFGKGAMSVLKEVLAIIHSLQDSDPNDIQTEVVALQNKYKDSDLEALFETDATTNGQYYALPAVELLTWFDEKGKEFKVTIKYTDEVQDS